MMWYNETKDERSQQRGIQHIDQNRVNEWGKVEEYLKCNQLIQE